MNTIKLLITVCFFAISGAAIGQSMEQKFQEADAELNRVYKELRGKLNEQQKALLKKSQQAWIKDKENYANGAPSAEEKLRILTGVTIERIADLKSGDLEYPPTGIQTDDSESSEVGADISDQDIAEILIGKWVHFEKRMHARVQFKPDGTYVQTELTPQTDETERSTGTWRIEKVHLVFRPNGEEESEPTELTIDNRDSISYDHYHFDREKD
jgi:hypothetical protein